MKIAIVGTRGIPANYGGFETFAEELSTRLVRRGHKALVYCRANNIKKRELFYKGVELVILPTIIHKYLDTVVHTFLSSIHVIFTDAEIVYFCNTVNAIFTFIPRLFGKKTVLNVDGLEWKRKKWNSLAKNVYKISERLATILPDRIITDSRAIHDYYKSKFGKETDYISYGSEIRKRIPPGPFMERYSLKPRGYILYVSRLEPENNAHVLIEAYEKVGGNMPLVIMGDAPYGKRYIDRLKATKDKRIKFVGSIYGNGYQELLSNAFIYIHGNEVGGTNPALLAAMAAGNCVIANGVDFNKEVIGDSGISYKPGNADDLRKKIEYLFEHPEEVVKYRDLATERVKEYYNWNDIIDKYEVFFTELIRKKRP